VPTATDAGVLLVGGAAVVPALGVVDVAEVGRQLASGMLAPGDQQTHGLSGRADEQPLTAPEIDRDTGGVDDDPPDVAGERRSQDVVGVQDDAVARLAAS
jgi:hypothetical protein